MATRILAVVQARMSSRRLPGKVLEPILGRPMLLHQLDRARRATLLDRLIVATSTDDSDDDVVRMCRDSGYDCERGSLHDVLDRFWQIASKDGAEHVVRLTGDCPLTDPEIIDLVVDAHLTDGADYTSNTRPRSTWPDGLDVEVVRAGALEQAWREAVTPSDREHVLPFVWSRPERFRLKAVNGEMDLGHWRWSVDEPSDFQLVEAIFAALYPRNPMFGFHDIQNLLRQKELNPRLDPGLAHGAEQTCLRRDDAKASPSIE